MSEDADGARRFHRDYEVEDEALTPLQLAERCRERLAEPCECRFHCAKSAAAHAFAEQRLARAAEVLDDRGRWPVEHEAAEQEIRTLAAALSVDDAR